jgi:hypothetical protein
MIGGALALAAAALAVVVLNGSDDTSAAERDRADFVEAASACEADERPPLGGLPLGLRYASLPAPQQQQLAASLEAGGVLPAEFVTGHRVLKGDRDAATVLVIPGPGDDPALREDFESGFIDAAKERGLELVESRYRGERLIAARGPGVTELIGTSGCYAFAVFTADPVNAEVVGQALVKEARG